MSEGRLSRTLQDAHAMRLMALLYQEGSLSVYDAENLAAGADMVGLHAQGYLRPLPPDRLALSMKGRMLLQQVGVPLIAAKHRLRHLLDEPSGAVVLEAILEWRGHNRNWLSERDLHLLKAFEHLASRSGRLGDFPLTSRTLSALVIAPDIAWGFRDAETYLNEVLLWHQLERTSLWSSQGKLLEMHRYQAIASLQRACEDVVASEHFLQTGQIPGVPGVGDTRILILVAASRALAALSSRKPDPVILLSFVGNGDYGTKVWERLDSSGHWSMRIVQEFLTKEGLEMPPSPHWAPPAVPPGGPLPSMLAQSVAESIQEEAHEMLAAALEWPRRRAALLQSYLRRSGVQEDLGEVLARLRAEDGDLRELFLGGGLRELEEDDRQRFLQILLKLLHANSLRAKEIRLGGLIK